MTKELLEKLKNAKTNEEFKQIIEDNKSVLNDEELEQIGGGGCYPMSTQCSKIMCRPY